MTDLQLNAILAGILDGSLTAYAHTADETHDRILEPLPSTTLWEKRKDGEKVNGREWVEVLPFADNLVTTP